MRQALVEKSRHIGSPYGGHHRYDWTVWCVGQGLNDRESGGVQVAMCGERCCWLWATGLSGDLDQSRKVSGLSMRPAVLSEGWVAEAGQ